MSSKSSRVGLLVTLLGGVAGCGGSSGVPLDNVAAESVAAICDEIRECPEVWRNEVGLIANLYEGGAQDARCEDILNNLPGIFRAPSDVAGVEDGSVVYDAAQGRRCVQAMVAACVPLDLAGDLEECQDVFTGTVALGDACASSSECAPGTYCEQSTPCEGVCTATLDLGDVCDSSDQCQASAGRSPRCELDGIDQVCVEYSIVRDVALGQPCGAVDDTGPSRITALCTANLYCLRDGPVGVCAEPIASGASCTSLEVCDAGQFCTGGSCRGVTFAHEVGATCSRAAYIFCDSSIGLACDEGTERCVSVGDGREGSPCTYPGDSFLSFFICDDGLYCNLLAPTPVCSARLDNGASCASDAQCVSGYCVSGECSAPVLCEQPLMML